MKEYKKAQTDMMKIIPDPQNPNKMGDEDKARMKKSLAEFGDLSGVVINRRTGYIIGGHQRVDVLKDAEIITEDLPKPEPDGTVARGYLKHGGRKYSVRVVDWPEKKAHAALLAANRFGRVGVDDSQLLKDMLEELDTGEFDMGLTGFTYDVIEHVIAEVNSNKYDCIEKMELQPFEKYDYIMLLFENSQDFSNACEKLGIGQVEVVYNPKCKKIGLGRVIPGKRFIEISEKKNEIYCNKQG